MMNLSTTGLKLAPDAAIDLQMHTVYSDGVWEPEQLLDHLVREQFGLAAITDHDRTDTAVTLQQLALDKQLPTLVATEMTTRWRGGITDVLCFGFDPQNDGALQNLVQDLAHRQRENTRETFENFQRKGVIPPQPKEVLLAILDKPSAQQTHELVALLKRHGHVEMSAVVRIAAEAGCALMTNDLAPVVEAAHQSGAVCLIAHPGRDDGFVTFDAQLLDQVRLDAPIDGLEVYYPKHTPAQTAVFQAYAQRHHLLMSAGSDSHGLGNPPIKYRADQCRALLERVGIEVI